MSTRPRFDSARRGRAVLAALLIAAMAGSACAGRASGPRLALEPGPRDAGIAAAQRADVWRQLAQRIAPGSGVRIVLADGSRMRAVLLSAGDDGVIVKRRTRLPEPEQRIAYATLELLELDTGGIGAAKAAAIGIGTGAAAFLGLLLVTFALVSD